MDTIGTRIIEMREINDISQVKLSQTIGITKATMSRYENNKSIPNAELIGKIADALNTTTDFLIGRTTDYSPLNNDKEWIPISEDKKKFLHAYTLLDDINKIRILERMETLIEEQVKKSNGFYGGAGLKNKQIDTIKY